MASGYAAGAAPSGVGDAPSNLLTVMSFNILAPSARICKPLDTIPWRERHSRICDLLQQMQPDIACLQEYDFAEKSAGFHELYLEKLGEDYEVHVLKRTGSKNEGLALLLLKSTWEAITVEKHILEPLYEDRVAQSVCMRHKIAGIYFKFANTHLTVAHATNDHDIPIARPQQMEQALDLVTESNTHHRESFTDWAALPDTKIVSMVIGDLNSDHLDTEPSGKYSAADVSKPQTMAFEAGFLSALHEAQCIKDLGGKRPISHTCSYAHDGCCDYIFFLPQSRFRFRDAYLYPREIPPDTAWDSEYGWARDATAALTVTLSDHRPLVAEFELAPSTTFQE